ncbi:hypothetical protein [Rhizobium sp. MHM7A]|uniref:hypothetical protein n=1 Tax=Rhizobium sp. MHM7A TaxID=2583233 RepID=UPI00110621E9|nr:hypothetical protein [Rhizobium sp. MHM7A]TLX16078.1 hypothetical protein FFR93_01790 [Rhizobium sp. MHM7A]
MTETTAQASGDTSNKAKSSSAPTPLKAKICVAVCLGLFAITALFILGLEGAVRDMWNAVTSDWRIPAITLSFFISAALLTWAIQHYPKQVARGAVVSIIGCIAAIWFWIATFVTNDGTHPVALSLIVPMVISTLLFACCAALHFGNDWGRSKSERFVLSFILASMFALLIAGIPVVNARDQDQRNAIAAAQKAFSELHINQTNVAVSELESSGNNFLCKIEESKARCVLAK